MPTSNRKQEKLAAEIRSIRKLKANKKCFDCVEKGPTYVCTNFATFICTPCAGVHREFNHVVKSTTMANFSEEEVEELSKGGNSFAKKLWRSRWKDTKNPKPESDDLQGIRDFIRATYIDKRWVRKLESKKKKSSRSKKKKRYVDSDEDEDEEDDDSEYEEKRKKKGRKKKGSKASSRNQQKQAVSPPAAAAAPKARSQQQQQVASVPSNQGASGANAIANLFGDMSIGGGQLQQPKQHHVPAPKPRLQAQKSEDSWANDEGWADFGVANAAPVPAQQQQQQQQQQQISQQPSAAAPTLNIFEDTTPQQPVRSTIPEFNIMDETAAAPNDVSVKGESKEGTKSPVAMHEALDDPFGDILGAEDASRESSNVNTMASAPNAPNREQTGNPFITGSTAPNQPQSQSSAAPATTTPNFNDAGSTASPFGMMGNGTPAPNNTSMGMGMYSPQMNQQQMLLMQQQQQYMMMLQQRQAMMMQMQAQGAGGWGAQPQMGQQQQPQQQQPNQQNPGFGQIDIGNPFSM
mmetsp:Transcript_5684/g.7973  ORF Transcript_5684/g.7973 Transcript_5684/m.7973 type:complete len:520 (-) Transcript_5684:115-1674(-)